MSFNLVGADLSLLGDAGLAANPCYPSTLVQDPTFAILNNDPYFKANRKRANRLWKQDIPDSLTDGKTQPFPNQKRWLNELRMGINTTEITNERGTALLTNEELEEFQKQWEMEEYFEKLEEIMLESEETIPTHFIPCRGDECATEWTAISK